MILNAAFYRFASWPSYREARPRVLEQCRQLGLRGTLLLSPEGINGSVCGSEEPVRALIEELRNIPQFQDLTVRESWSECPSFERLKVKLKREIIPMGGISTHPELKTGQRLAPQELKRWLDEGRDLLLVDTRNRYEVDEGSFEGAWNPELSHFRDFPERLGDLRKQAAGRPVVMFCTGGIRCEKASALALERGIPDVYQLDGGILKYFEECGGAHFQGDCFVFDDRVALRPDLSAHPLAARREAW